MCGIIACISTNQTNTLYLKEVLDSLSQMEYRGYDSVGVAFHTSRKGERIAHKAAGKVSDFRKDKNEEQQLFSAIGHTRWATHGPANKTNAHPHIAKNITLVHNGIIENYKELKEELKDRGAECISDTDSEVAAWLIQQTLAQDAELSLAQAVRKVTKMIDGTYGLVVTDELTPDEIVVTRKGSPLLISQADGAIWAASDALAIGNKGRTVHYLEEEDIAVIHANGSVQITSPASNQSQQATFEPLSVDTEGAQKEGYEHFLIKEIFDQPTKLKDTFRGRLQSNSGSVHLGGLELTNKELARISRILILGCGTSYYSGLLAKYALEELLDIPVDVELASEYRYRPTPVIPGQIGVVLSQSGETADTLAAVQKLKDSGVHTIGLVNVVGSSIARAVDGGIYLHAGPEISVASTKAFSAQYCSLLMLGCAVAQAKNHNAKKVADIVNELSVLPNHIDSTLKLNDTIAAITQSWGKYDNVIYCGRSSLYPVALESALKLKEVSYIHAEGYAGGELKHGPLALIDDRFLTINFIQSDNDIAHKAAANASEVMARNGDSFIFSANRGIAESYEGMYIDTFQTKWTEPLILNVVGQLIAYHLANQKNLPIDQPRNLAKSVTVE